VRRRPHAVVLFDEMEKAHADVFNLLLQILDDGRLTDAQGRTVDFRNAIIIMTSNIGSQFISQRAGSAPWEEIEGFVDQEIRSSFRPEFLNRVDDTILFRPLKEDDLLAIVHIQLARIVALAQDRGVALEVGPEAAQIIAKEGYDPAYGARPLKRAIERLVQNPLAIHLLEAEISEGTVIRVVPGDEPGTLAFA
jgi:ATP-dependent Clp protease ATP-binding subunit ClpB